MKAVDDRATPIPMALRGRATPSVRHDDDEEERDFLVVRECVLLSTRGEKLAGS
jgi:hypothetical protein